MERGFTEVRVWVNGTFDVLHIGHIKLFEFASKFGKVRVGVDTDKRVKLLKGSKRPFNKLKDRVDFLQSIKFIDSVVSFNSDEELKQEIIDWKSNYIIIGSDYKDRTIIGSELAEVIYFDRLEEHSTTKILERK
jgi:cytidyltransferase-like protein